MKKALAIVLTSILLLGIFSGCKQEEPNFFEVGYGRVDISPDYSVPYNSSGDMSTHVEEHLYTTCVAFRDNDTTVLLFHNDLVGSPIDPIGFAITEIEEATGVPSENVMVSATHVHRAPHIGPAYSHLKNVAEYHKDLREWMVEAAVAAVADLKPAEIYTNSVETQGHSFIRHYYMNDGTVCGDNFGDKSSGYKQSVSEPDREMQLVKFTREGCKDIVLVNFQTHPHSARGTFVTSDQVGSMRESMEKRLDCQFIYFTGAAGNINPYSKIDGEAAVNGYQNKGVALADYAVEAKDTYTKVNSGDVRLVNYILEAEPKEGVEFVPEINMNVFTIGDVAFVIAPCEMFDANGRQIKEGSPYETTIVCTCAYNRSDKQYYPFSPYYGYEGVGYIPSYEAYEYEGVGLSYEATAGIYARGTGEKVADKFVEMLTQLKENK